MSSSVGKELRRTARLMAGFARAGYWDTVSYPLNAILGYVSALTPVILLYFIGRLVEAPALGGVDYFTFVVVGTFALRILGAGLEEFGQVVQRFIDQGQLELLLVEPIREPTLPFVLMVWPLVNRLISAMVVLGVGIALGAEIDIDRLGSVIAVLVLGVAAAHGVGVLSMSIRILAKRGDPITTFYLFGAQLLTGALFPISLLPGPLRLLSWALPHTYAVDATRTLMVSGGERAARYEIGESLLALGAFTVVAYAVALFALHRSLALGRRMGILGSY